MRTLLLFILLLRTYAWYKIPKSIKKQQYKLYKSQLSNITHLEAWRDEIGLSNNSCFIHVPRTGGMSFRNTARKINISLKVWHSNIKPPPMECGCMTNIRDPIRRYISEWKYYGMRFFDREEKLFGWMPKNGFPHSFEEYINDTSTHNAFTKVFSGCQMFSDCHVTEENIDHIIKRVKDKCLKVFHTENTPVHTHNAIYKTVDRNWLARSEKANHLDVQLYRRLLQLERDS